MCGKEAQQRFWQEDKLRLKGLFRLSNRKHGDCRLDNNCLVLPGLDFRKDLNYSFTPELCGVCTGKGWNGAGMMGCFLVVFFDLFFLKQHLFFLKGSDHN